MWPLFIMLVYVPKHLCSYRERKPTPNWQLLRGGRRPPQSVVCVGALSVVHVPREHVVVHVDRAAVVDGVAQALCHDQLAGVGGQPQLEEARL